MKHGIDMSARDTVLEDMEHRPVMTSDEVEIGEIFDFVMDRNYKLIYFVAKKGKDTYLIAPEQIASMKEGLVRLSIPHNEVKRYREEEPGWKSFTTLRTKQVYDSRGDNIGQVLDAVIHSDRHVSFIVGGKSFKRFLSLFGISSENMIVPHRYIKSIDPYTIELHKSKDELERMFFGRPLDSRTYLSYEAKQRMSEEMDIRLHRESYYQLPHMK